MAMLSDSIWPGEILDSWDNLALRASAAGEEVTRGRKLLFRGQPSQWTLAPSLLRSMPRGASFQSLERAEREAIRHFQSHAHLFADEQLTQEHVDGSKELAWWTLMQHYGAPTRLMDWSQSPFVAAYFAVDQNPDEDGVVLSIDRSCINDHFIRTREAAGGRSFYRTEIDPPALSAFTLNRKTRRIAIQQSYFIVATHPNCEHDALLQTAGAIVRRWVIPASLKPSVLRHLRTMNVSAQSLFPGLDGLGRSVRERIRSMLK